MSCIIVIAIALLVTIDFTQGSVTSRYFKCQLFCKDYLDSKYKSNVCQGAFNIMPKPDVYNACLRGKTIGFEHACMSSCIEDTNDARSKMNSSNACKSMERKPLPNFQLPWCHRGYDKTYSKVKEIISDAIEQSLPTTRKKVESLEERVRSSAAETAFSITEEGEVTHVEQEEITIDDDVSDQDPIASNEYVDLQPEDTTISSPHFAERDNDIDKMSLENNVDMNDIETNIDMTESNIDLNVQRISEESFVDAETVDNEDSTGDTQDDTAETLAENSTFQQLEDEEADAMDDMDWQSDGKVDYFAEKDMHSSHVIQDSQFDEALF